MEILESGGTYSRGYRKKLGFANQAQTKGFFGAKDIIPDIDFDYLACLNERLGEIVGRMNSAVTKEVCNGHPTNFRKEFIERPFLLMKKNGILPKLNNLGRRPEDVYFSWMRGYVIQSYFSTAIDLIFETDTRRRVLIGDDDFTKLETFKRSPKADMEVELPSGEKIRLEIQAGFTGVNDIKKHKVTQAKKVFEISGVSTLAAHFDLYNGYAAFLRLDSIREEDANWVHRQQMEGQVVFSIDEKYFVWKMTEPPVKYRDFKLL